MPDKKPIFDVIRKMLGRGFTTAEVQALDAVLDGRRTPDAPTRPEQAHIPVKIGLAGVKLIQQFEGCHKKLPDGRVLAYPDPGTGGAPWTIGWGATGPGIAPGVVWTQQECDDRLKSDLKRYAADVVRALGASINSTSQAQFDAMVSFHYNTGAIGRATLTRKHRAGDYKGAADEFARWNRAGGRVLAGLTRRRKAEADLYRSGM